MYRLNPKEEPVVNTNFSMTREIKPVKARINYLKNKKPVNKCMDHSEYGVHNHKFRRTKNKYQRSVNGKLYSTSKTPIETYDNKYGNSLKNKFNFTLKKSAMTKTSKPKLYGRVKYRNTYSNMNRARSYSQTFKA